MTPVRRAVLQIIKGPFSRGELVIFGSLQDGKLKAAITAKGIQRLNSRPFR